MNLSQHVGFVVTLACGACGPGSGAASDAGDSSSGETGAAGTSVVTGEDTPTGTGEPEDGLVLCSFELSQVVAAPREVEQRFTDEQLPFSGPMAWSDGQLLVAFKLETGEGEPRRWAIGTSIDATTELSSQWDLPPEAYPTVIIDAPDGVLVVADARHSDLTGGLLRLGPGGAHEVLVETQSSGPSFDAAHPVATIDGQIYARMFLSGGAGAAEATRVPAIGGALEAFEFDARLYGVVGGGLIGLNTRSGPRACEPDCLPPLASLALARHDLATRETTTIAAPICITGNPGYEPSVTGGRLVHPVAVTTDGLIVNEGALVEIGFDGSHRVIAAVEDGIAGAVAHAGSIYFVSGDTFSSTDLLQLRRVAIAGGVVEELASFADASSLAISALSDTHVYALLDVDLVTPTGRAVVRVPL
jgi:hypothetical protein